MSTPPIGVLENPSNMRTANAFGVGKLYIIGDKYESEAAKWMNVHHFKTTAECIAHLQENDVTMIGVSPHVKGRHNKRLEELNAVEFSKLAMWFGNERCGLSDAVVDECDTLIQMDTRGGIDLGVAFGVVMYVVTTVRRVASSKESVV